MEHDQSSYFCRGPDDFCWGPAPVGPILVMRLAIGFIFGTEQTKIAGLEPGEGRTTIDSVVWAQYINVSDRQTDSHVAIANAALTRFQLTPS